MTIIITVILALGILGILVSGAYVYRESYGYDEFGQDLYGNQGQTQPFGYTGYQPERIAGTYYAQAREYVPSVGKFASRDLDRYMRIQDPNSINLYNYCVSNPMRYVDPSGNSLENIIGDEESPYAGVVKHSENDAVQINVKDNTMTIDVYVQFIGNKGCTTQNGTPCKELAQAGMEQWSGYYRDVLGENIEVVVNVHEEDGSRSASQEYVQIFFEYNGVFEEAKYVHTEWAFEADWEKAGSKQIYMYETNRKDNYTYSDEQYVRAIAHEMLHVHGIDEGYYDPTREDGPQDAYKLNIIDKDDIARSHFNKLIISNTDIGMLIQAFADDEYQHFTDYGGHKQSEYIKSMKGKE